MARTSGGGPALARADFDKSLVIGFYGPRRIGSIVKEIVTDASRQPLPLTPMLILGEATIEDWRAGILRDGAVPTDPDPNSSFFYFVSTD